MSSRSARILLAAGLLVAGCAHVAPQRPSALAPAPFSGNTAGELPPAGWSPWLITRSKAPTAYRLVTDHHAGGTVVHARAESAASGLHQELDVDPEVLPVVRWRWRLGVLPAEADNAVRERDDAAARLLLFFEGDVDALPPRERMLRELARLASGREVPHSTLVYVASDRHPSDAVLAHPLTTQVRTVVVDDQPRSGNWLQFERNYADDYRRAFDAPPRRLVGIGILSDSDNLRTTVEAWYGDIELRPSPPLAAERQLPAALPAGVR